MDTASRSEDRLPQLGEHRANDGLPPRAGAGVAACGGRLRRDHRAVHRGHRLASPRYVQDERRSGHERRRRLGALPRRREPVHLRRLGLADVLRHESHGHDRGVRPALRRASRRDPPRPEGGPMSVSAAIDRETLAGLADALIPAGDRMPAASEAGATGSLLDEVLRVRGDLEDPLAALTTAAAGKDPAAEVERLKAEEPELFEALTT